MTHFSDVIGATHDANFSFWGENHIATDAFKSLAEFGSVRALDVELRSKGARLRTLIKAAGLWYPSVNTNTTSNFRTDRIHHKLSVVSMFGPSPDWVVGVSGLNLCEMDCTWKDSLDIDLYPWDAGTDNGITYMVIELDFPLFYSIVIVNHFFCLCYFLMCSHQIRKHFHVNECVK